MKVKWLGHATFLITSNNGIKIVTDPYTTTETFKYGEINETANIVTISHEHRDHNNVASVKGNPAVVREDQEARGIKFEGIPTYHDTSGGSQRGKNTIFCMEIDGLRVCHLGDLGHPLSEKEVNQIGKVDIFLIPVGGYYTIDAAVATEVCHQVAPKVVIPMHYKTARIPEFPISGVDDFLKGKTDISQLDTSETDFTKEKLPATTQIVVLQPAL
jgi:L-ascorbate metabolism protein UlaG (beta-lactamase superfamily)